MEEKIYSRAAAKASLSDLVIDQENPTRSFTKKEMDLLQHENTWLCCEFCDKWRMLPPGLTAEQIEKQTSMEVWCCGDNIYDEDRQCCEAEERDQNWMLNFWEKRARQEAGMNSQSQSQNEASQTEVVPFTSTDESKYEALTERDEVLQTLLSRTEEKRSSSTKEGAANSSNKSSMSWISKYSFAKEKSADDESKLKAAKAEAAAATSKAKATSSPKKKVSSPKKKVSSPKKKVSSPKKKVSSPKKKVSSPKTNAMSLPKKNGSSTAKKNGTAPSEKNGTSPFKKNGTSPTRIEKKFLSPEKNGSLTNIKEEICSPTRSGDRKRGSSFNSSEGGEPPKQPSIKKQKEDVIDLCDSD